MNNEEVPGKQTLNVCDQGNVKRNSLSLLRRVIGSAAILFPLLALTILIHVVLRYTLGINFVWLEELHWQLYAYLGTLSVAFSFITNGHVRLDLLRQHFSQQTLRTFEAVGLMFFVVPFTGLISWHGFRSVAQSYAIGEHSVNEQGLPYTFIVKLALPLSCSCILYGAFIWLLAFLLRRSASAPFSKKINFQKFLWSWKLGVGVAISISFGGLAWWAGQIDPRYALVVAMFVSFVALLFTGYPIAFVLGGVAVAFIFVGYTTDYLGYTLTFDHSGTKLYLGQCSWICKSDIRRTFKETRTCRTSNVYFYGSFVRSKWHGEANDESDATNCLDGFAAAWQSVSSSSGFYLLQAQVLSEPRWFCWG